MSTYNLTLSDNLLKRAKGSFPTQEAIKVWMEQQIERMLRQISVDEQQQNKPLRAVHVSERIKSLSAVPPSSSHEDYKDELTDVISDKY